jgi:hypothetical protein
MDRWAAATILSYDSSLRQIEESGTTSGTWHNLMASYADRLENARGDFGFQVRLKGIAPRHEDDLGGKLLFTLWRGDHALQHDILSKWKSEASCLRIVAALLDEQPLRQWSAPWLINTKTGASLYVDGYFPMHRLAVEHQGIQHFEPVEAFGGECAFRELQIRDECKRTLLAAHGITVLAIRYNEATRARISEILAQLRLVKGEPLTFGSSI